MATNFATRIAATILALIPAVACAADFTGKYVGAQITVTILDKAGQYTGAIRIGGKDLPLVATEQGGKLVGTFTAEGEQFQFTAEKNGTMLSFDSDGTTHVLVQEREAGAAGRVTGGNPLDRTSPPAAANPLENRKASPAAPAGNSAAPMRFRKISIQDPGINNIECVSMLIPAGWQTEGGVKWMHDYRILTNLLLRISDPQTGAAIEFLPIQNFTFLSNPVVPMQRGQNYMGNVVWEPVQDVPTLVQTFYMPQTLSHLQGARPVAVENLDKVAAEITRASAGQATARCQRVRYEFQVNGQPWEEDVYATIVYAPNQMGTFWGVPAAYSFRAPRGMLDRITPVMTACTSSMRLNLDWYCGYQYVQSLFDKRMRGAIDDAGKISETISRNSEEIRRMFSDSYRQRCESQDRISAGVSEAIRGVDTYKNPFEDRPIQLPTGYRDAWVNASGEYILSDDSGFDPNVGSTTEWRRMDRRGEGTFHPND